jgi:DNA-binding response OmpR family regulator
MTNADDTFPSEEASTTARMRPHGAFVLVVHDSTVDGVGVWDALHDEYIVREATSAFDALEWLSGTPLACVVCVLGVTFSGEDFYNLVTRLSAEQAQRVVFVAASDDPDVAFLERAQCNWLATPVRPEELVALVRAVSTR